MLCGRRFVALVDGEARAPVVFREDGRIDGFSALAGRVGFHLTSRGADDGFAGLYSWDAEDPLEAPARHHVDARKTVRLVAADAFALLHDDVEVDRSPAAGGLPTSFAAKGLVVEAWPPNTYEELPAAGLLRVRDDLATLALARVSAGCFVSVGEAGRYADHAPRTVVLLDEAAYQASCLAAKYDVFGFRDRLGFDGARAYAVRAARLAVARLGPQSFLDIGSGTVAAGPFRDAALRAELSLPGCPWVCLDVAQAHCAANAGDPTLRPLHGDLCSVELPSCSAAIAKDSLNNLSWPALRCALARLREAGLRHLLVNGAPGFDNASRFAEGPACEAWKYRSFDPSGAGLDLDLVELFPAQEDGEHPGVWGLYRF